MDGPGAEGKRGSPQPWCWKKSSRERPLLEAGEGAHPARRGAPGRLEVGHPPKRVGTPAPLPASRRSTHFKPSGNSEKRPSKNGLRGLCFAKTGSWRDQPILRVVHVSSADGRVAGHIPGNIITETGELVVRSRRSAESLGVGLADDAGAVDQISPGVDPGDRRCHTRISRRRPERLTPLAARLHARRRWNPRPRELVRREAPSRSARRGAPVDVALTS